MPNAPHAATFPARARAGLRGWAPISLAGMSAVTSASSA